MTQLINRTYPLKEDLLETLFGEPLNFFDRPSQSGLKRSSFRKVPLELIEEADATLAQLEVPGFKKDDIDIHYEDRVLTISGEVKESTKLESGETSNVVHRQFKQQAYIPDIQFDQATAELDHGILTIKLPKTVDTKAQKLQIN